MYDSVECSRILPLGISCCESLVKLSLVEVEDYVLAKCPDLPKLKKLVLDIMRPSGYQSLLCFTPLMSVAPSLRELVLKVS
ncbi:hypothetical protein MIMGU_mgv1a019314mg [Erythranthe guttata]|uniref:Uncharacterized protein n=1 Tax=Erythranthe guttata TaxID=4155 RepID=A0A022RLF1_ERYGU|nr:hypothetical protein MIMGU_mgv1a019314mg [Erythranthe guttata]